MDISLIPTDQSRPTPGELELSEGARSLIPQDERSWMLRQYDRMAATLAMPGDQMARELFSEFAEVGTNLERGLDRSFYDYQVAALNVGDYVADKLGVDFDDKQELRAALAKKYKNIPMNPTSQEWEDQLFYMIGNLVPDVAVTFLGGGVLGGAARIGATAIGMGKKASAVTTMAGRIMGDTAANVGTFMAHEAGQAEIEGREADYAQAGKDAIAMSAAMSTTARLGQAIGLKRRYNILLTGAVTGEMARLNGADDDNIAASRILGGLFGSAIKTGNAGPVDIVKWVRVQKRFDRPVNFEEYLKEFRPLAHDEIYVREAEHDKMLHRIAIDQVDPNYLSPKDNFHLMLERYTNKDTAGHTDDQMVNLLADMIENSGGFSMLNKDRLGPGETRIPSFSRRENLESAKTFIDSVNEVNTKWMADNPKYNPTWKQVKWEKERPRHRKTLTRIDKGVPPKEKDMLGDPIIPTDVDGNVASYGKSKLKLHQLSKQEVKELFGFTGKLSKDSGATKWNESLFGLHREAVENAAKMFDPADAKTLPHKGALLDYDMWKDFGYIHRQVEFQDLVKNQGDFPSMAAALKDQISASNKAGKNALDFAEAESKMSIVDHLYRFGVATEGRLYNKLERGDALAVRNAHQLRYTVKDEVALKFDDLDKALGWNDWDPNYRDWFDTYYRLDVEPDFAQRRGADPPVERRIFKNINSRDIEVVKHYIKENVKQYAGGIELFMKRVGMVKREFDSVFREMLDEKLIGQNTYDRLSKFKYIPQKTIEEIRDTSYFYNIGMRRKTKDEYDSISSEATMLKDLVEGVNKDMFYDTEYLLKNHIAMLRHKIAKNKFLQEAARLPQNELSMFRTEKPKGYAGKKLPNYQHYTYVKDGKEKSIWIEGRTAALLESTGDTQFKKALGKIGWLFGSKPVKLTAVGINPVFALATHPLDMLHIFTHHKALSKIFPKLVWDFEVYNKERGFAPFLKNFKSAWRKDQVFKDYVTNHGTTSTLISHISAQELIKGAKKGLVDAKATGTAAKSYNRAIEFFGKFGHSMEVATRMTEVDMLMSTGKFDKAGATAESLRRLNYSRRGTAMEWIDSVIPFANSAAQILASNISELKTPGGAARSMFMMGQVSLGLALHRAYAEEQFPGFFQDVPWDDRMRYWVIPTPMTTKNPETNETLGVYFRIKKAYNPVFSVMDAIAQYQMDKHYYGTKGLPPQSKFDSIMDAIKASTPIELRSLLPPSAQVWSILQNNNDLEGREIYKGPKVELQDEVNTKLTGGRETHGLYSMIADAAPEGTVSPARLQGATSAYFASNPLGYFVSQPFALDPATSQSVVDNILKFVGSRRFFGTTRPSWRDWELGNKWSKISGSQEKNNLTDQIEKTILRYHAGDINAGQMSKEVSSNIMKTGDIESIRRIKRIINTEIRTREHINKLRKKYGDQETFDNIGTRAFWNKLKQIPRAKERASYYYNEFIQIDESWHPTFKWFAKQYGILGDPLFGKELKKLQQKGDSL